jgi:hypothetical protein
MTEHTDRIGLKPLWKDVLIGGEVKAKLCLAPTSSAMDKICSGGEVTADGVCVHYHESDICGAKWGLCKYQAENEENDDNGETEEVFCGNDGRREEEDLGGHE